MKTEIVKLSEQSSNLPSAIINNRLMSNNEWIEKHASGTLRDNKELGFVWSIQCMAERCAYTFGYNFAPFKSHLVTFNRSISECDDQAYTLSGRMTKRYIANRLFEEDYFELKYVIIRSEDGKIEWEGIGLIVRETSATFIPNNSLVLAKISRYVPNVGWLKVSNFA